MYKPLNLVAALIFATPVVVSASNLYQYSFDINNVQLSGTFLGDPDPVFSQKIGNLHQITIDANGLPLDVNTAYYTSYSTNNFKLGGGIVNFNGVNDFAWFNVNTSLRPQQFATAGLMTYALFDFLGGAIDIYQYDKVFGPTINQSTFKHYPIQDWTLITLAYNVPEPSFVTLLGVSLFGFYVSRRKVNVKNIGCVPRAHKSATS